MSNYRLCVNCGQNQTSAPDGMCAPCAVAAVNHGHYNPAVEGRPSIDSPAMQALIDEYHAKATREGFLHLGDASEALAATRDYALRNWLSDFILRWDTAEAIERGEFGPDGSDAELMARALIAVLGTPRNANADAFHRSAREALRKVVRS